MATQKKPKGKKSRKPSQPEVKFFVEPGTKVQITEEQPEVEEVPQPTKVENISVHPASTLRARFDALKNYLKTYDLAMWLFIFAVAIYLITRLIGLTRFPIYFFTDEAI